MGNPWPPKKRQNRPILRLVHTKKISDKKRGTNTGGAVSLCHTSGNIQEYSHIRKLAIDLLIADAKLSQEEAWSIKQDNIDFNQGLITLPRGAKVAYIATERLLRSLVTMVLMRNIVNNECSSCGSGNKWAREVKKYLKKIKESTQEKPWHCVTSFDCWISDLKKDEQANF